MSKIELANASNAIAVYSQPEILKEKITGWIQDPDTYNDDAQASFAESINRYAMGMVDNIRSYVKFSEKKRSIFIKKKRDSDLISLNRKPSLIAKSLGSGTIGGLATAHIATQVATAMAIASYATPAGLVGGGGSAMFYFYLERKVQTKEIIQKYLRTAAQIECVVNKMILPLIQRRSDLQLNEANAEISRLSEINAKLNAQVANISEDLSTERGRITDLQTSLDTANNSIGLLDTNVTNSNNQLAAAQLSITGLNGSIAALQLENQGLRTSLTTNQTNLTATAARIDAVQRQNAQNLVEMRDQSAVNLANIQQMNRDLLAEMRAEFQAREQKIVSEQEARERSAAARQIVERGIEKSLRREQEEKNLKLNIDLNRKSAAFEILQADHDQLANRIGQRFDVMTQTMARNPAESSVRDLFRFDDRPEVLALGSESEDDNDFIEIPEGT